MFEHKVFIGYSQDDAETALKLYNDLKNEGVELWFAREKLMPGQKWDIEIEKAISESSFFLALVSSKSTKKEGFTQGELKQALDMAFKRSSTDLFVIPVRIDDCRLSEKLQHLHWVDLFPSYDEGLQKLLRVLKPDITSKPTAVWKRR